MKTIIEEIEVGDDPGVIMATANLMLRGMVNILEFEGHRLGRPPIIPKFEFSLEDGRLKLWMDYDVNDGGERFYTVNKKGEAVPLPYGGESPAKPWANSPCPN